MTKVIPSANTSGIAAEFAIRIRLLNSKNRGFIAPIKSDNAISAKNGA
jgi:hypothetical protein